MLPKNYWTSIRHALHGFRYFYRYESNSYLHSFAAILVILIGVWVQLSRTEWLWILLAIAVVFITEIINSALERLCDKITLENDTDIKIIKDLSASSVLFASIFAVVIASIIFIPYLLS